MNNPTTHANCEKCVGGHYFNCVKGRCIHGSIAKSIVGMAEAVFWNAKGTYKYIDNIICCSEFMKRKMDTNPLFKDKTVVLHNFIEKPEVKSVKKEDYVLYFGRFSREKGVRTLLEAAKRLPNIKFVFAGSGDYVEEMNSINNVKYAGFQTDDTLDTLIRKARFSICPSEWYENCPFSVMESQSKNTVVIGARIGGVPELVIDGENGLLFESGNVDSLVDAITRLWNDDKLLERLETACNNIEKDDVNQYVKKYLEICGMW